MQLYEYAIIKQEKLDKDGDVVEAGAILVDPTYVLANSVAEVNIVASRAIPEDAIGDLERITLAVRPF